MVINYKKVFFVFAAAWQSVIFASGIKVLDFKGIGSISLRAGDPLPERKSMEIDVARDPLALFRSPVIIDKLTRTEKQQLIFKLFSEHLPPKDFSSEVLLPPHAVEELNLLCGETGALQTNIKYMLDKTQTTFGSVVLARLLAQPRRDIAVIKARQNFIKALVQDEALYNQCREILARVQEAENNFLTIWMPNNPLANTMIQTQLFYSWKKLKFINRLPKTLEVFRAANLSLPALSVAFHLAIGAYFLKINYPYYKNGDINSFEYFYNPSLLFGSCVYFGYIINQIVQGSERFKKTAQDLMINTATILDACKQVGKITKDSFNLEKTSSLDALCLHSPETFSKNGLELLQLLQKNTFKGQASSFSFLGRAVSAYHTMIEVKNEFIPALEALGEFDALVSIATLIKEHKDKNGKFCFVDFVESETPVLQFTDGWNPLINPDVVVTETMNFGKNGVRNLLLTGPHGSGKSSFMRGAIYIVLMAQEFGVAPAFSCKITPFAKINTYLNIKEDYSKKLSTFMAERQRVDEIQDMITSLEAGEFAFSIMDEVFKGTMEEEGAKRVHRYGKVIAEHPHSICLMATHFNFPTCLEEETNGKFVNYHVALEEHKNGLFTRKFKLAPGKNAWWFNDGQKRDRFIEWLQTVA